jgi:type I restriction enzyme S subunit
MITYSIIQKSQLEGALRLDAEYYQAEYLEIKKKIKKFGKWYFLGDLIERFNSGKNWPQTDKGKIKFLRTQHIRNILIQDEEDLTFCKEVPSNNLLLKKGDLLFSRVGGVSDNSVASKEYEGHFYSDNVLRIRIKKLNPFFVSVFLNSYYGKNQLEQVMKGIAQPLISRENFENIIIPEPTEIFQEEIEKIVLDAYVLRNESILLYSQAENLLLEELGLKDFKVKDDLFYVVNLSEIKSDHRADAEYFQPKYEKIFNYLKCPIKTLEKITEFLNHAKQPPYIDNGEIPIITQKHLGRAFLNLEAIADPETKFTNEEWLKKYPQYQLKAGDVLYYSVGAYIGKTNIVLEDLKVTVASFITIIRTTEEINPIYLTVVLNSIIGQLQSEKWQSATAQQYIYPKDIKNFKIPILPKPTQQKIADLVQKSHEARKKAKQLLEQAKRKVEELIEEN